MKNKKLFIGIGAAAVAVAVAAGLAVGLAGNSAPPAAADDGQAAAAPAVASAEVEFHTNHGVMVVKVDGENAPVSAANFLQYAADGFYDNLIFHRVIPGFVIQGGGFSPAMEQKETRPPIINEGKNGLKNRKYSLSMARLPAPDTATSQFFINLADNAALDPNPNNPAGYAVFGEVVEGREVVDSIAAVPTGVHGHFRDVPTEAVIINKAVVREAAAE